MKRLWQFLKKPRNRHVLSWFGGGLATIAAASWAVFVYFDQPADNHRTETRPNVEARGGSVAAGRDIRNSKIIIGYSSKQVEALVAGIMSDERAAHAAEINELSQKLKVTKKAVINFLEILGRDPDLPQDRLVETLAEIAERHKRLLARLRVLDAEDPAVAEAIAAARTAIEDGDYGRAERLLSQAEDQELAAIRRTEELAQQARAAADQRRRNAAALRAERGELQLTKLDYLAAAEAFQTAAELLPESAREQRGDYVDRQAKALYLQGTRRPDKLSLAQAVATHENALEIRTRDQLPQDWAMTQNNLGVVLSEQGVRTGGEAARRLLARSVAAYENALDVFTRDQLPQQWAMTQNNLGNALRKQGARTGGEAGRRLLARAVAAYENALDVFTRDQLPRQWAMIQNNLSIVLLDQGTRTGGEAGRWLLARAVAACEDALQIRTRDRLPQQWATTQNNLGNALRKQGARTGGEAGRHLLARAVAAYENALDVYTRDQLPQQWAMTQNNLGAALSQQGTRTGGDAGRRLLARAVAAYENALNVYTRDQLPQQWAMTQNNLGGALSEQGIRTGGDAGRQLLARAMEAFKKALSVFEAARMNYHVQSTTRNMAAVERLLGRDLIRSDQ